ncbi:hypothetical protein D9M71_399540 [compost metagenome]
MENRNRPTSCTLNWASQRSLPRSVMVTTCQLSLRTGRQRSITASLSWPSANTLLETVTAWPTMALAAYSPPSITGVVFSITKRGNSKAWDSGNGCSRSLLPWAA